MDTAQRAAAAKLRLQELKANELVRSDFGPPCRQCRFSPINATGDGICEHEIHWERRHDPVSGKWHGGVTTTTREARSEDGLCGPEALLFEPYSPLQRIAKRFGMMPPNTLFYVLFWGVLGIFFLFCAVLITITGRW